MKPAGAMGSLPGKLVVTLFPCKVSRLEHVSCMQILRFSNICLYDGTQALAGGTLSFLLSQDLARRILWPRCTTVHKRPRGVALTKCISHDMNDCWHQIGCIRLLLLLDQL